MTSPIERVPYDVLREIILYSDKYTLKATIREPKFDLQVLAPPITASHVCRSWRRNLLSDPTMWTCLVIPDTKPDGIMELFRRSGSSPLNVFLQLNDACNLGYEGTLDIFITLFEQIHRFSVLRLQIDPWYYQCSFSDLIEASVPVLMSSLQRPAPRLQAFSFSYMSLDIGREFNPDYAVIGNLFSGNAPNLKRVHHRLSLRPQESRCAAFNDLSELYLTPPYYMLFDTFIDLLEASPRLKLLHFHAILDDVKINFAPSSDRKVHLPCLETLVLEVTTAAQMLGLFMEHVTFPSNVNWHISVPHLPKFEESLPLLQLLSQARFTYLRVQINRTSVYLRFEEEPYADQSNGNILVYKHRARDRSIDLWNTLMRAMKSSHIIDMDLQPDNLSNHYEILPIIFTELSSLKALDIRPISAYKLPLDTNNIQLACLAALIPDLENIEENTDTTNSIQNPESNSVVDTSAHNSAQPNLPTPVIYCPLLRTVTINLSNPLQKKQAEMLAKYSDIRRKVDHPLQIRVHCPAQIDEDVEHILQQLELNDAIRISIIPSV